MKIYINLIPQKEKNNLQAEKIVGCILKLSFSTVLAILVLVGFLFSCIIIIDVQENVYQEEIEKIKSNEYNKTIQETKQEAQKYNKKAALLNKRLEDHKNWKTIEELNEILPSGVFHSSLSVSSEEIEMAGFARTRDDLIKLEERLREKDFFQNAKIPISSFTSRENINFEVTFKYGNE
ncbi:MAG: PilN domain-containing protein [Patescibacteria group bacterium]